MTTKPATELHRILRPDNHEPNQIFHRWRRQLANAGSLLISLVLIITSFFVPAMAQRRIELSVDVSKAGAKIDRLEPKSVSVVSVEQ